MTDPKPPFDSEDVSDIFARIQQNPEALRETLEQLAPLVAAEGIDLADLENVDAHELIAAMTKAIERRQMELHTPVGDARALTMATLGDLARAIHYEKPTLADHIFRSIARETDQSRPIATYVVGVVLETLDSIYTNTKLRTALGVVRLPELTDATRAAAQDIQQSAAQGQAFNSRENMVSQHSTYDVGRAAIYLFTATVAAIAEHGKTHFNTVLDELLSAQNFSGESSPENSSDASMTEQTAAQQYVRDFGTWLQNTADFAEDASDVFEKFTTIESEARLVGVNVHRPDHFEAWLSLLQDADQDQIEVAIEVYNYYLGFRAATDVDPAQWHHARDTLFDIIVGPVKPEGDSDQDFAALQRVDPERQHRALLKLPIITGAFKLQDWLSQERPVTESGLPLQSDIQQVAAMLELDIEGAETVPAENPERYVQSALEAPALVSWWWTLKTLQVIEVSASTVQLGPAAEEYLSQDPMPKQEADILTSVYVAQTLVHGLTFIDVDEIAVPIAIQKMLDSITGKNEAADYDLGDWSEQVVHIRIRQLLNALDATGLIELRNGEIYIPIALRSAVTTGMRTALGAFGRHLGDAPS